MTAILLIGLLLGCAERPVPPEVEGSRTVHRVDDHTHALLVWARAGARDRTVVHVDGHDDFRRIPDPAIGEIRRLIDSGRFDALEERMDTGPDELLNMGNFLFAAHRLGMVNHIVFAGGLGRGPLDAEVASVELLRLQYPREDAATFRNVDGLATGQLLGAPFQLVFLGDLTARAEPVLLDVDTDVFPLAVEGGRSMDLESAVDQFAADLRFSGLEWDLATVASSTRWGFTPLEYAWLGDVVEAVLHQPTATVPEALRPVLTKRSRADTLARAGDIDAARAALEALLLELPNDPSTRSHLASLAMEQGDLETAEEHALLAASADPVHARGLLGLALAGASADRQRSLELLEVARRAGVQDHLVRGVRANIHFNAGHFDAALVDYQAMQGRVRGAAMFTGDALMLLGRHAEALRAYERGLGELAAGNVEQPETFAYSFALMGLYYEQVLAQPEAAKEWYARYSSAFDEGPGRAGALARLERWRSAGIGPAAAAPSSGGVVGAVP